MLGEQSHEKFPVKSPAIFQDGHVRDSIYTAASCDLYSQIPNRCYSYIGSRQAWLGSEGNQEVDWT